MRFFSLVRVRTVALLLVLVVSPAAGWADGTVTTVDLLKSLALSNPKLAQALQRGFDLDNDAVGTVIGNAINPSLGGARIGPYTVRARPKGSSGAMDLVIVIHTDVVFLDRAGRQVTQPGRATRMKEQLKSFEVTTAP